MGLTGVILKVAVQLRRIESGYINQKKIILENIGETIREMSNNKKYEYAVAWIDTSANGKKLGRSVLTLGNHAKQKDVNTVKLAMFSQRKKRGVSIGFDIPFRLFRRSIIFILNRAYFYLQKTSKKETFVYWENFFFPLDYILDWNRLYGKQGLMQYQCVLPVKNSLIVIFLLFH